jgi:hypothetical protein
MRYQTSTKHGINKPEMDSAITSRPLNKEETPETQEGGENQNNSDKPKHNQKQ